MKLSGEDTRPGRRVFLFPFVAVREHTPNATQPQYISKAFKIIGVSV